MSSNTEDKPLRDENGKVQIMATNKDERIMEILASTAAVGIAIHNIIGGLRGGDPVEVFEASGSHRESIEKMAELMKLNQLSEAMELLDGAEFNNAAQ